MKLITRILSLLLVASITVAAGSSAQLSWVVPTSYNDATPLPQTDIAFYTVSWGTNTLKVVAPALAATVNVPCGSTNFSITVTTTATAKYPNATSTPSGPVPYATGLACVPNPPTGLAVH